jgi:hypothetical protein
MQPFSREPETERAHPQWPASASAAWLDRIAMQVGCLLVGLLLVGILSAAAPLVEGPEANPGGSGANMAAASIAFAEVEAADGCDRQLPIDPSDAPIEQRRLPGSGHGDADASSAEEPEEEEEEEEAQTCSGDQLRWSCGECAATWARRRDGPLLVATCRPAAPPRAPPASRSDDCSRPFWIAA